ncbi:MAG TPA: hypothetical protein VF339_19275 [Gammaproteobacteria bacterium]
MEGWIGGAGLAAIAVAFLVAKHQPSLVDESDRSSETHSLERSVPVRPEPADEVDQPSQGEAVVQEPAVPKEEPSDERVSSWREEYIRADDLFAFSARAAEAAIAGDSRAQYYLGQALRTCYREIGPIQRSGLGVEEYIQQAISRAPFAPANFLTILRQRIARCERFLSAESLSRDSIPPALGEYRYWLDAAIAGDPLAVMERSHVATVGLSNADEETARQIKAQMLLDIRVAIDSKEPAAIAAVGNVFWSVEVAKKPWFQGPAWHLAACQRGYDCTSENPEFLMVSCNDRISTSCPTLQDILLRDYGAEYGRVYSAGQDIAYKVQVGDWDGLQQYLEMK